MLNLCLTVSIRPAVILCKVYNFAYKFRYSYKFSFDLFSCLFKWCYRPMYPFLEPDHTVGIFFSIFTIVCGLQVIAF